MKEKSITWVKDLKHQNRPIILNLETILNVIKTGGKNGIIKKQIVELRKLTGDEYNINKQKLSATVFSGVFENGIKGSLPIPFSYLVCLDFDKLDNIQEIKTKLANEPFCISVWLSPSGVGLKMLVRVSTADFKGHVLALMERYKDLKVDAKCKNINRLCFDSYDPEIYINYDAEAYATTIEAKKIKEFHSVGSADNITKFDVIRKWVNSRGITFAQGSRNEYVFQLALLGCDTGINENDFVSLISQTIYLSSDFTQREVEQTVKSAYSKGTPNSIEITDKKLIKDGEEYNWEKKELKTSGRIIRLADIEDDFDYMTANGMGSAETTYMGNLDKQWKWRKGELTVLNGFPNMGKSALMSYLLFLKSKFNGDKWVIFSPEHDANTYLHFLLWYVMGKKAGKDDLKTAEYISAKGFINEHFFIISNDEVPTIENILESSFIAHLEFKINGILIDPYNQMVHKSNEHEGEKAGHVLKSLKRFIMVHKLYGIIIAHPKTGTPTDKTPSMYSLHGGNIWGAHADNILSWHRDIDAETGKYTANGQLTSHKIKLQEIVGELGFTDNIVLNKLRWIYTVNGYSVFNDAKKEPVDFTESKSKLEPNTDFDYKPNNLMEDEYGDPF